MSAFDRCVKKMEKRAGVDSPAGLCAAIGRRKYGAAGMAKLAAAGRRRNSPGLSLPQLTLIAHHAQDSAAEYKQAPAAGVVDRLAKSALRHVGMDKAPAADKSAALVLFKREFRHAIGHRKNPRNPAASAAEAYELFHGRPADSEVTIETEVHEHDFVAGLGDLEALVVLAPDDSEVEITGFDGALLTMNEDRTQLFIDGGDQTVDLADFGYEPPFKELMILGEVLRVDYFTTKDHLGADGGEAVYQHTFGEEGGERPLLLYRVRDGLLELAGGSYTIPAEGITD